MYYSFDKKKNENIVSSEGREREREKMLNSDVIIKMSPHCVSKSYDVLPDGRKTFVQCIVSMDPYDRMIRSSSYFIRLFRGSEGKMAAHIYRTVCHNLTNLLETNHVTHRFPSTLAHKKDKLTCLLPFNESGPEYGPIEWDEISKDYNKEAPTIISRQIIEYESGRRRVEHIKYHMAFSRDEGKKEAK